LHLLYGGNLVSVNSGEVLFAEGDFKETMYIVLSGKMEIYKTNKSIAIRTVGDFFGAMGLMESKPRSASLRAISNSILLELDKNAFFSYLDTRPKIILGNNENFFGA